MIFLRNPTPLSIALLFFVCITTALRWLSLPLGIRACLILVAAVVVATAALTLAAYIYNRRQEVTPGGYGIRGLSGALSD